MPCKCSNCNVEQIVKDLFSTEQFIWNIIIGRALG